MNDPLQIQPSEFGLVRVFLSFDEIDAVKLPKLLSADLDHNKIEVFPSENISALGLSHYLCEGYGVAEGAIKGQRAWLDGLEGWLVLIPSTAFITKPQTLNLPNALQLVGAYGQDKHQNPDAPEIPASAKGKAKVQETTPFETQPVKTPSWIIALGALLLAAALVLILTF